MLSEVQRIPAGKSASTPLGFRRPTSMSGRRASPCLLARREADLAAVDRSSHQEDDQPLRAVDAENENLLDVGGAAGAGDEDEFAAGLRVGHAGSDLFPRRRQMLDQLLRPGHNQADRREVAHQPFFGPAASDHRTARVGQEIIGLDQPGRQIGHAPRRPIRLGPSDAFRGKLRGQLAAERPIHGRERGPARPVAQLAEFAPRILDTAARRTSPWTASSSD